MKRTSALDSALRKFDSASDRAREFIYRKVLEHSQKHPNSPWSGASLVDLESTIREFYASLGREYDAIFRETLSPFMQTAYDRACEEMRKAGLRRAIVGKPDPKRVKYFLDSTFEQVALKTRKMSFEHIRQLRSISAEVLRQMSIASGTRREVSRSLLEKALRIPGFEFIDSSGRKWSNKSYFEMLARTELMNAARSSYDDKCAEEGFDVMLLTTSGNCCEKCARFEGELFSLTGATKGLPTKADLEEAGVFHPNCTHSYSLVPDYRPEKPADAAKSGTGGKPMAMLTRPPSKETPEQHRARRQQQWEAAYDKRRDKWNKSILDSGGSKEVADTLSGMYTPELAKIKKPPSIIFEQGGAHTTLPTKNSPGTIVLHPDKSNWDGIPNTARHEFGHWVDFAVRRHDPARIVEFNAAAAADLKRIKTQDGFDPDSYAYNNGKIGKHWRDLAHTKFGRNPLTAEESHILATYGDTLGSISKGEFGGGHRVDYYKRYDIFHAEAFANAFAAYMRKDEQFRLEFPNMTAYIEKLMKGQKK